MLQKSESVLVCAIGVAIAAWLRDMAAIIPVALCLAVFVPKTKNVLTACALSSAVFGLFYAALAGLVAMGIMPSPEAIGQIDRGPPSVLVFAQSVAIGPYRLTPAPVPDGPDTVTANASAPVDAAAAPRIVFILQESTVSPTQIDAPGTFVPQHLFVDGAGSHAAPLQSRRLGAGRG